MNKTLQSLFCFCAAAMVFCSCVKEETDPVASPAVKLRAVFADSYSATNKNGSKVVVDNTVTPAFLDGDEVWVSGDLFTASVDGDDFTLSGSASSPFAAVYPYDCVDLAMQGESTGFPVALTLPAEQPYEVDGSGNQIINAPIAALASSEPLLEFKNVCSLVRVRVRNNMDKGTFTLSSITLTASSAYLSGPASITESAGSFTLAVSSGSNSVTLTGLSEIVEENKSSKDYYIYIPPITTGNQLTVSAQGVFQKQALECTLQYQTEQTDITYDQSKVGYVSMLLNGCNMTSMHSAYYFSVAADKKVYFSPGNLQWQGSTGEWRFAEEQWIAYTNSDEGGNMLSETNVQSSALWSDLFCWATSGYNNSNTYYYPYNRRSNGTGTSSTSGYGYGPTGNGYKTSIDGTNSDWGVYNPIKNGGNTAGQWRTPTSAEWTYVYSGRSSASSLRTRATVEGVTGFVLLPDTWVKPDGVDITTNASTASTNVYNVSQWRKLEQNGAIFLPATGYINKLQTSTTYTFKKSDWLSSDYGYYWSATYNSTSDSYCFRFQTSSTTAANNNQHRSYRLAVRLVQDKVE